MGYFVDVLTYEPAVPRLRFGCSHLFATLPVFDATPLSLVPATWRILTFRLWLISLPVTSLRSPHRWRFVANPGVPPEVHVDEGVPAVVLLVESAWRSGRLAVRCRGLGTGKNVSRGLECEIIWYFVNSQLCPNNKVYTWYEYLPQECY